MNSANAARVREGSVPLQDNIVWDDNVESLLFFLFQNSKRPGIFVENLFQQMETAKMELEVEQEKRNDIVER